MSTIFQYPIAYVEQLSNFESKRSAACAAGIKGLAIKVFDAGENPAAVENRQRLMTGEGAVLRSLGFVLGAWACPRTAPTSSAGALSRIYANLSLSFVVWETEWEYKSDGGGLDVAVLIKAWRALRPKAYTGFAVEGGPPTTFNHAAVQADPNSFLCPENYWLQHGSYDQRASLTRCLQLGWTLDRVKPTLTGVEGHSMSEAIIRAYRAEMSVLPTQGYLVWRGDMLGAEDYRLLGLATGLALPAYR